MNAGVINKNDSRNGRLESAIEIGNSHVAIDNGIALTLNNTVASIADEKRGNMTCIR